MQDSERTLPEIERDRTAVVEMIGAVAAEHNHLTTNPQDIVDPTGHEVMLETDRQELIKKEQSLVKEGQARTDKRLAEIRANGEQNKNSTQDPTVTDSSGNRMTMSERAELVRAGEIQSSNSGGRVG